MKAFLIEKDGTQHEMEIEGAKTEIEGADTAGVVLRIDMRMRPPLRVFRYAPVGGGLHCGAPIGECEHTATTCLTCIEGRLPCTDCDGRTATAAA